MPRFGFDTTPLWIHTAPSRRFPKLESDLRVDVAIIGGGMTGLTAAEILKEAGKSVAVLEMHRIGRGESGHTTAHLTEILDTDFQDLINKFGVEGGRLACQSNRVAIQKIEENIKKYSIDCHFQRVSAYKYTETTDDIPYLEDEADAALKLSVPNTVTIDIPLPFRSRLGIRFDHQAQFHPTRYLGALANAIESPDCLIFEDTRVLDIDEGDPNVLYTESGTVTASQVIVAANVPILNRVFLHTKIAPYRTYAIAIRALDDWFSSELFWDTDDPYHYTRTETIDGQRFVIIGGEDHKTGHENHTDIHFQKLEEYARERFRVDSVAYRWSGQIINPVDHLPYIGVNSASKNVFVSTGYMGNGMTFGTVGGMLLPDLILGRDNPWAELYDATRFKPLASAVDFISENVDFPSHLISDRLSAADEKSLSAIPEDEGRIVRVGVKKVAAYRDPEGQLHLLSPVCPHLGCYVGWNEAEKSWDCPCHGSRFSPTGHLLNGPAMADLKSETYEENLQLRPAPYAPEAEKSLGEPHGPPLLSFFSCPLKTT